MSTIAHITAARTPIDSPWFLTPIHAMTGTGSNARSAKAHLAPAAAQRVPRIKIALMQSTQVARRHRPAQEVPWRKSGVMSRIIWTLRAAKANRATNDRRAYAIGVGAPGTGDTKARGATGVGIWYDGALPISLDLASSRSRGII
jgi:hypothetical protein